MRPQYRPKQETRGETMTIKLSAHLTARQKGDMKGKWIARNYGRAKFARYENLASRFNRASPYCTQENAARRLLAV